MIKPQKPSTRLMAFASDSDSDDDLRKKKIPIGESITQKRQARIIQEDALKEDPTIFQYDEVYDEINTNREEAKKAKSTEVRQSKYINKLLVAAEKRKIEYESRIERKVQKERDAEGDKFKDKEVFVTAAYRQKLEAMKKAEEEAEREEYLESIGDVRKQKDLSGFYRHMFEQKLGGDESKTKPTTENDETVPEIKKHESSKRRKYRKHSVHEDSDNDEQSTLQVKPIDGESSSKKIHLQSNLDADSDFSIDSSSDSDTESKKEQKNKKENQVKKHKPETESKIDENEKTKQLDVSKNDETKIEPKENANGNIKKEIDDNDSNAKEKIDEKQMPPPKEVKPKIDIWKKRTVGDVYLAAVKRYYERKQASA